MQDIIFEVPEGYKLNKESSDNKKIVLRYNGWITYDRLFTTLHNNSYLCT